jgi:putative ABC transport system permease protein
VSGGRQRQPPVDVRVLTVWLTTWRDLQWRLRRFVIAGTGAALVFAMTLVLAGLSSSFAAEAQRTVDVIDADTWVTATGVDGVFTTPSVVAASRAAEVARAPGVERADPIVVVHHTVMRDDVVDVNLIGYVDGGLGQPAGVTGRLPSAPDEVVADRALGARVGERIDLAGKRFDVVGTTTGMTINAGQPLIFLRLEDAQQVLVAGADVASAIVTRGVPESLPEGLAARSRIETRDGLLRPLEGAIASIELTKWLLWLVAALVVGSVVYLSALERARDFAVYKATGWSTRSLAAGLALQAVLLSVGASLVGVLLATALVPVFPIVFTIPLSAALLLPAVGVLVGLLACATGLRRAVGVDPALAFGGAA